MSNLGFDPLWRSPLFRPPLDDLPGFRVGQLNAVPAGEPNAVGWQPPLSATGEASPDGALPVPEATPVPWWERQPDPVNVFQNSLEPRWPWLRAPTDEVPGFRLDAEGSVRVKEPGSKISLMSGALVPLDPQEPPNDVAVDGATSSVAPSPPADPSPSAFATSIALPASGGVATDFAALARRVGSELARHAGPAIARFGSAALGSLPGLLVPAEIGSETTDLGNGLRTRVRRGQRTVEVEQRTDNGWKTLPVDAQYVVGKDGTAKVVINHEQLNRALGRYAPSDTSDAGISAMAQPPKDVAPGQPPATADDPAASSVDKPGVAVPPATQSAATSKIDAKALEEEKQPDPEEERLLACRAVRAMPGKPAPPGQYAGPGGIGTAVGIRVAPGFPAPKGGYDYSPDYLRHYNGYKGELELKNRIEKAVPYEKFVHYGNPAGDQGPDVLTIGPDNRFMEWDSRSRVAKRRLGPSLASSASLRPEDVKNYVWNAIRSRAIAPEAGARALQELAEGNYNVCTVGTSNAYDGYFESVRNSVSTGPRR